MCFVMVKFAIGDEPGVTFTTQATATNAPAHVAPPEKTWPPEGGVPMTQWGKLVSPDKPVLPEYPRPQLVREQWTNLNGSWDYAITALKSSAPASYDGHILVPYPIESVLSQVNKRVDGKSRLWYHRTFDVPSTWAGQRVLIHFGAVNWDASVTLNGKSLGAHQGGYDDFSFDITDDLSASGSQDLVVSIANPLETGEPRGKQARKPGGIFYTSSTGIWQTVWLEPVPSSHIDGLKLIPDVDHNQLTVMATVNNAQATSAGQTLEAVVLAAGQEVAKATGATGSPLVISIPNAKLWWPASPFLYDLKVTLKQNDTVVDSVGSYFGMRKISLGSDKDGNAVIMLNNKFIFENGLLDQGFWPDGVYTAPTDDALRADIEMAKAMGFNMLRKHMKVEPDRWYYWSDKLGILVWQDMPAAIEMGYSKHPEYLPDIEGQYERELRRMIQGRINHPSIVVWIPFNEGWGLTYAAEKSPDGMSLPAPESKGREERMVTAIREEDPTRLIDAESGAGGGGKDRKEDLWNFGFGDILDYHAYGGQIPVPEKNRAIVIGEYGWGPDPSARVPQFLKSLEGKGISGMVLTQLTDVENETNGPIKYDRTPKGAVTLEKTGETIVQAFHDAGYADYPGGSDQTAS